MDIKESALILNKINSLHQVIVQNNGKISSIEKDLMLDYIRNLYDLFLSNANGTADQLKQSPTHSPSTTQPSFEIVAPPNNPPKFIEIDDNEETKDWAVSQDLPKNQPTPPPPPKPEFTSTFKESSTKKTDNNIIETLFEQKKATDLSEKLSESPINDLTRAMSINDRLLYMNELFGRDIEALNETLKLLNKYDSLDQAKGLISNLAEQYKWMDEEKVEIAQNFIKLIRRKYS